MEPTMSETFDYQQMDREERPFARRLCLWISCQDMGRMVDLGAGTGVYVEEYQRQGNSAQGYDITDPQPRPDLVHTQSMLTVSDPAPVVLCLEVAEHIDAQHSEAVVESIWRNTLPGGMVIFSAAQPGQGGVGHINCQPPSYWRNLAQAQGFVFDADLEEDLMTWITDGYHMGWFANNGQIWIRNK